MRPNSFFTRAGFFLFLFTVSLSSYAGIDADSTRPLTKVNKQFLIVAHIILSKDSMPSITELTIKNQIAAVNTLFAPIGVSFSVCEFRYIYNYTYDQLNKLPPYTDELVGKYNVNNRINMYFSLAFQSANEPICGLATLQGIGMPNNIKAIWISKNCATPGTIGHELGHYFGLKHTFENYGSELADGSNCATSGDNICDTPADPYIDGLNIYTYIDGSCRFISEAKDAHNQYYDPDVSNIMGYYTPCVCLKFTHDQYEKMAQNYLSNPISW